MSEKKENNNNLKIKGKKSPKKIFKKLRGDNSITRTSELLEEQIDAIEPLEKVSIQHFIDAFEQRSFGFLIMILSLPSCFPGLLPPPLPSVLAIPLVIISFQLMLDFDKPKLPKFVTNYSVKSGFIIKVLNKSIWLFKKIEKVIRPRFPSVVDGFAERVIGLYILIMALTVAIPFPLTNFVPSVAMVFFALAIIERDGLLAILGYIIGAVGVAIAAGAIGAMLLLLVKAFDEITLINSVTEFFV